MTDSYLGIIASLPVFPQPSPLPLYSSLASPLQVKPGSKNSGELNSHNNMRLSGDRRNTVCAGQYRGGNSTEPGLLTARKCCDKRLTVGICLCVVSESSSFLFLSPFCCLFNGILFLSPINLKHAKICPLKKRKKKKTKHRVTMSIKNLICL